ncbi:MAG: tetratricopeptide repeat protein [Akkermansiaceae bacterium]|nr:tetratricopeptide repeat protein [Verrucomicrobiales bacterium]
MKTASLLPASKPFSAPCVQPRSNEPADIKDWCLARADVWYQQKDFGLARTFLQFALDIDPRDTPVWIALGSLHFTTGNLGAALLAFNQANELNPGNLAIQLHLALTHQQREEWAEAENGFRNALAIAPNDVQTTKLYSGMLMARNRLSDARILLERTLASDLSDAELFTRLGVCCFRTGDFRAAKACFAYQLKLNPFDALARENLSVVEAKISNPPAL